MLRLQSQVDVAGLTAREVADFLSDCDTARYQQWWVGTHLRLEVASAFTAIVMLLDAVIAAGVVQGRFAMFASLVGTWLPFALIFAPTYATGRLVWRALDRSRSTGRSSRRDECERPR
jgi:hypothetical protein